MLFKKSQHADYSKALDMLFSAGTEIQHWLDEIAGCCYCVTSMSSMQLLCGILWSYSRHESIWPVVRKFVDTAPQPAAPLTCLCTSFESSSWAYCAVWAGAWALLSHLLQQLSTQRLRLDRETVCAGELWLATREDGKGKPGHDIFLLWAASVHAHV